MIKTVKRYVLGTASEQDDIIYTETAADQWVGLDKLSSQRYIVFSTGNREVD